MLDTIESIPAAATEWMHVNLSIPRPESSDLPDDFYEPRLLLYRDPIELVRDLFGDPAFQGHMAFDPVKEYIQESGDRVYSEIHTGNMWWDEQVRIHVRQ
jgi:hypothetical protein